MQPYKRHPRDPFTMGRARVELYKPGTHEPVVASIPSKQKLLEEIARVLPEDPARKHNQQQIAMAKAEMERRQAAFAASRQGKAALQAQAHAAAKAQAAVGSPEAGGKKKKR